MIGQDLCDALCASDDSNHAEALRLAFTSLMSTKKEDLQGPLESHKAKVSSKAAKDPLDELFLRLWEQGQVSKERNDTKINICLSFGLNLKVKVKVKHELNEIIVI